MPEHQHKLHMRQIHVLPRIQVLLRATCTDMAAQVRCLWGTWQALPWEQIKARLFLIGTLAGPVLAVK